MSSASLNDTANASFTYKETGLGMESYSHQGTYSTSPSYSTSAGTYDRDNWNFRIGSDSTTQTYTKIDSETTRSGSATETQ